MRNGMIYFDSASTSYPKPEVVIEAMQRYCVEIGASPGRGGYPAQTQGAALVDSCREKLARMTGARRAKEVAFTHNATHAINIVLKGYLRSGDHVIISAFEHNAVVRPLERLKRDCGIEYDVWGKEYCFEELKKLVTPQTKLICLNHASNVFGTLAPAEEVAAFCRQKELSLLLDVSQTAGLFPINIDADFIAGTGHKCLLGPPGVGFLAVKDSDMLTTLYEGGSGPNSASAFHPESMPDKFEAGTLNYLGIAGLSAALDYLETLVEPRNRLLELTQKAHRLLSSLPEITVYGPERENKVPLLSFNVEGQHPVEVAHALESSGFCLRAGLHCAPLAHKSFGTYPHGTLRLSFGRQNSFEEVEKLAENLLTLRKSHV